MGCKVIEQRCLCRAETGGKGPAVYWARGLLGPWRYIVQEGGAGGGDGVPRGGARQEGGRLRCFAKPTGRPALICWPTRPTFSFYFMAKAV